VHQIGGGRVTVREVDTILAQTLTVVCGDHHDQPATVVRRLGRLEKPPQPGVEVADLSCVTSPVLTGPALGPDHLVGRDAADPTLEFEGGQLGLHQPVLGSESFRVALRRSVGAVWVVVLNPEEERPVAAIREPSDGAGRGPLCDPLEGSGAVCFVVRQLVVEVFEAPVEADPASQHRVADECCRLVAGLSEERSQSRLPTQPGRAVAVADGMVLHPPRRE